MTNRDQIHDVLERFFNKKATDDDIAMLQLWIEEDPSNRDYFDEYNKNFQTSSTNSRFNSQQVNHAWLRFSARIKNEDVITHNTFIASRYYNNILRIAAAILITLIASFWTWTSLPIHKDQSQEIVINNSAGNSAFVILPDSTTVWLNGESTLTHSKSFGIKNREVSLKGEAYFDVRKKQGKNFIVKTDRLLINVKGTRFNVHAYEGEDFNTTLEEGKVELTVNKGNKTYSMIPGDQLTIRKNEGEVILKKVNPANFTAWKEEVLTFDNTTLSDIVLKLENRFKVDIIVNERIAKREHFSMTIKNETLDEVLSMIQLSSHLNYKKENTKIIIYE